MRRVMSYLIAALIITAIASLVASVPLWAACALAGQVEEQYR